MTRRLPLIHKHYFRRHRPQTANPRGITISNDNNNINNNNDKYDQLRNRAEEMLAQKSEIKPDKAREGIGDLLHELNVHQAELEIQNEELRRARHKLEDALEKYSDLYDYAPVGYFTLDRHGVILQANLTAAGMLKTHRSNLTGRSFADFVSNDYRQAFSNHIRSFFSGKKPYRTVELEVLASDGEDFYAILSSETAENTPDETEVIRTALQDITKRKMLEYELKDKNREMEDFVHRVSHDIKSPLITVGNYLELVKSDPEKYLKIIPSLIDRIDSLAEHLDKMLRLSKAGQAKGEKVEVFIGKTINFALSSINLESLEHEINVDCSNTRIIGDRHSIYILFSNLLENAAKYHDPEKDRLKIDVSCRSNDGMLELSVKDNGIGIEKEKLNRIFEPGYTCSPVMGTGFGLAIVKKIVESHNGKITAKSPGLGQGTEFLIRLPQD